MAKGVLIDVQGLKAIQKRIGKISENVVQYVDGKLAHAAKDFANRAVQDAPVDQSILRQGISDKKIKVMDYEAVSSADYSAYIEFGTKSKARIPTDLTQYAAQFRNKGKKGGFFEKILAWVKRTGIAGRFSVKSRKKLNSKEDKEREYQAARAIYYSILKNGINAHPFFFKQRGPVYKQLQQELQQTLKQALKK